MATRETLLMGGTNRSASLQEVLGKREYTVPTFRKLLVAVTERLELLNTLSGGRTIPTNASQTRGNPKVLQANASTRQRSGVQGKSEDVETDAGSNNPRPPQDTEDGQTLVWDAEMFERAVWSAAKLPGGSPSESNADRRTKKRVRR
jgi:hypothetical protein